MVETKYVSRDNMIQILGKIKATYVQQVAGKGLSTNDFTTELLNKLNGIAAGAQVNVIEKFSVNGVNQTITDKGVDIAVPVKVSELTNDKNYLTQVSESNLDAALAEKVNAAADGNHSHANKALLDTYTQTEADLADAVSKKHSHTNASVLNGITAEKVSAWDAAEGNSKTYADGLNTAMDGRVAAIEGDYLKQADKYDDTALVGRVAAIEADYLKEEDKYDDTALAARVTANEEAIEVLNGSGEGSVDKKITDAFNDFSTKVTDDGVVNSYKELIDYAAENGSDFTKLVGTVTEQGTAIEGLTGRMTTAEGDIDAVEGRMATAEGKISSLETASATHALQSDLTAEVNRATAAEAQALADAKAYTDGKDTAMGARVKAIEDDYVKASELVAYTDAEIDEIWNAAMA